MGRVSYTQIQIKVLFQSNNCRHCLFFRTQNLIQHQFCHPRHIQKCKLNKIAHGEIVVGIKSYCKFCKLAAVMYPNVVISFNIQSFNQWKNSREIDLMFFTGDSSI